MSDTQQVRLLASSTVRLSQKEDNADLERIFFSSTSAKVTTRRVPHVRKNHKKATEHDREKQIRRKLSADPRHGEIREVQRAGFRQASKFCSVEVLIFSLIWTHFSKHQNLQHFQQFMLPIKN